MAVPLFDSTTPLEPIRSRIHAAVQEVLDAETWILGPQVEDRCDATVTRVREGVVDVEDFVAGRTVSVRAGETYVARGDRDVVALRAQHVDDRPQHEHVGAVREIDPDAHAGGEAIR